MEVLCNSGAVEGALLTKPADCSMMTVGGPEAERPWDECEVSLDNDANGRREGIGVDCAEDASSAGNVERAVRNEPVGMPGDGPGSPAKTGFLAADSFEANCRTGTAREALHEEEPCAPVLDQEGFCGISVTDKKPTENRDGTLVFHGTDDVQASEHANCSSSDCLEQVAEPDEVSNLLAANVVPLTEEDLQEKGTGIAKKSKEPEQVLVNALQVDQEDGLALPAELTTSPDFVAGRGSIVHELNGVLMLEKSTDVVLLGSETTFFGRPSSPLGHADLDRSVSGEHERDLVLDSHDNDMRTPALKLDFGGRDDSITEETVRKDEGFFYTHGAEDVREKDVKKAEESGSVGSVGNNTLVRSENQVTKKDMPEATQVHPSSSVSEKSLGIPVEHLLGNCIEGACMVRSPLSNAECESVAKLHVNRSMGLLSVEEIPSPMDLSERVPHVSKANGSDRPQVALSNVKGHDVCEAAVTSKSVHDTFQAISSGLLLEPSSKREKKPGVEGIEWRADHLPAPQLGQVDSNVDRMCPDNLEDGDPNSKGEEDGVLHCHTSLTSDASNQVQLTIKAAIAVESDHEKRVNCMDGVLHEYEQGALGQLSFSTPSDQGLSVIKDVQSEVGPSSLHLTKLSPLECIEFQAKYNKAQRLPLGAEEDNSLGQLGSIAMIAEPGGAASSFDIESGAVLDICDVRKDFANMVQQNQTSVGEAIVSGCPDTHKECEVESANSNQEGQELIEGQDQNSINCAQGGEFRVVKTTTAEDVPPEFFDRTGADAVREGIANGDTNLRREELQPKTLNEGADQSSANCATEDHSYVNCQEASKSRECQLELTVSHFGRRDLKTSIEDNPVRNLKTTDLEMTLDPIVPVGDEKPLKLPKVGTAEDATTLQQGDGPALECKPSCDCGVPAIEKVFGSKSENRGLRYLSCAACGHKQTNPKKRKQPEAKTCRFFQWVDVPRVTEEERKINQKQKRLRLEQNTSSGNVCTRAALKQTKLTGEDATMKTSSSIEATVPQKNLASEPSSSAVDTTVHHGSTSTASEVAMPPSKQVSQYSSLKKRPKMPRATVGSNLVLTSPTKSTLTAASLSEVVKSASNSKSVTPSSSSPPEARCKSGKPSPEKSFQKRYFDDRNNPTVDWLVSKRLAFKSLSDVVDRPVKALDRKVAQSLIANDGTDFRPKRRKLAAIIKSEIRPVVKGKAMPSKGWRMDNNSVKECSQRASVLVASELGVPVNGKGTLAAAGSNQGGKAKRKRVSEDKVLAKKPSAVKKSRTIQEDGLADSDPGTIAPSKTLKSGQEYSVQKRLIETCKSGEAVWVDVPLSSPVVSSKEAKDKHPQLLGEKARAHLRNSKAAVQRDRGIDQDSSQHQEKVEAGLCDASQVDIGSAQENMCYKEARDEKFPRHNTERDAMKSDGCCTTGIQRNRRRSAVS